MLKAIQKELKKHPWKRKFIVGNRLYWLNKEGTKVILRLNTGFHFHCPRCNTQTPVADMGFRNQPTGFISDQPYCGSCRHTH